MYKDGENIGYMVPAHVIRHFFNDIKDGRCDDFPAIGVFVRHVFANSPAYGLIRPEDIIVTIDGHPIADDGTVEFRRRERTSYTHYVDMHQMGERMHIDLLRDSKKERVTFELTKRKNDFRLVQEEQYDRMPQYFIFGGIVFTPLTKNLIKAWGRNWRTKAPKNLLFELNTWPTDERREVIIALQVLASAVNSGYHDVSSRIIEEVNGVPVVDFEDFYQKIMNCGDAYVVFGDQKKFRIVIDSEKARETHRQILATYRISSDRSADLKKRPTKDRPEKH